MAHYPLTVYKASAGSGKTFTLATEYIKLVVRNPQNYRLILAVTFTNKATEEMKMRILTHLYGIWRGLPESRSYADKVYKALDGELSQQQIAERAGQALHLLLHNYSYFRVETIDSFFQSVLRNLARELNLTANLRVELNDVQVEETAVDQLIDSLSASDLLLQWLMKYIMDNISDDRSWNVIGGIKRFGRTIFRDYYKRHGDELHRVMGQKDFFDHYQQQLRRIRQQALQRMTDIADRFFNALEEEQLTVGDLSYGRSGVASLFLKLQKGIFDESVLTKRALDCAGNEEAWCKKSHPRRDAICHLASTTLDQLLREAIDEQPRQWKLYKSADLTLAHLSQLRLLGSIEQKVRQLNDEQNRFLLSDTQQLLHQLIDGSDTPFIFEKMGTQLEHIMIDEFQDTSTVQWQNFKVLLQETMSRHGSENLIVGDVKQSIYRWRSGDWRLLAGIKKQFAHSPTMVDVKDLSVNYRSAPRIVSFNNAFFTVAAKLELADHDSAEGQTPTDETRAYDDVCQEVPDDADHDKGSVSITLLPSEGYDQRTLDLLSSQVAELLEEGVKPADIAILVRTNSYIPLIARHFMEQLPGLKVVSDEAFRLDASPAVMAIIHAMRLMANPADTIAQACLEKTTGMAFKDILDKMDEQRLSQLPLYEQAETLYALLGLDGMEQQSAYLCAFFDQVTTFATDRGSSIDAFLRAWDDDLCGKTIQSPENDGLRIISIHKSKGLEFPVVLIPYCDWRLEMPDILWCAPTEAPFNQLPLAPIDFSQKGMKGTIYEADYNEEHQQNIVDNLNLLYVAFTRAVSRLYVYGRRKSSAITRSSLIEQVLPQVVEKLNRPNGPSSPNSPSSPTPNPSRGGEGRIYSQDRNYAAKLYTQGKHTAVKLYTQGERAAAKLYTPLPPAGGVGGGAGAGQAILTGQEDEQQPLVFEYSPTPNSPTPNPSRGGEGSIYSQDRNDAAKLYNQGEHTAAKLTTPLPPAGGVGGGAVGAIGSSSNPFLLPSTPIRVPIHIHPSKADFKQSNQTREFTKPEQTDGDSQQTDGDSRQTDGGNLRQNDDSQQHDSDSQQQAAYIRLGNVLHRVLASIGSTDDIDDALSQLESDGILGSDEPLSRRHLSRLLRQRLLDAKVSDWFQPGRWQLFNECTILTIDPSSGRVVSRRPDRVMTDGTQTIVVDFKFGNDRPAYHQQVQQYMSLLQAMGHTQVKGYLWLVYTNKIIEV